MGCLSQSCLQPRRHHTGALVLNPPRPLLPHQVAIPADTRVTDMQPPQLTPTKTNWALAQKEELGGKRREGKVRGKDSSRWPGGRREATGDRAGSPGLQQEVGPGAWISRPGLGSLGRKAERGSCCPSHPASGYCEGTGPGDKTSGPPERETPLCTQLGLSPVLTGG